jgi:hypothetical protein
MGRILCLLATLCACSTWSAQNKAAANDCMRRCEAQRGPDRPSEEVHGSRPDTSLVTWRSSQCQQRCSAAATGEDASDVSAPPHDRSTWRQV